MKKKAVYVLLLFISLLILACDSEFSEVQRAINKDQVAIEVGEDVELLYSDSGRIEIRIVAPLLYRHLDTKEPRREFPKGLTVYFLNEEQEVDSWLIGNYAIEYELEDQTIFRDSVVVVGKNKEVLQTEHLIWDERNQKIHTNQLVRITTMDKEIWGYGFEADRSFAHWSIKAVKGEMKIDPSNLNQ